MSEEKTEGIKFYGKIDLNRKGEVASERPAWACPRQIDDLQESINRKKRALDRGEIPPDSILETRAELKREEERIEEMKGQLRAVKEQIAEIEKQNYKGFAKQ